MGYILNAVGTIYAILSLLPFVSFGLLWVVLYFKFENKKKATNLAMDFTTPLLIGAVAVMYDLIFESSSFGGIWLIILIFLIFGGLIGNLQNRLKGKVHIKKLVRVIWRIGFLVLSTSYILFLFLGIGIYYANL
ncbi:DUF3397 domain-containing protein [Chengkuizengella axinellae]|uniref:DUF3397 domain-containing protein n=1 Tax=Chengkuizengella axinellae TaxID=3064388 RepID=A0ABT9IUZ6_9BACL|nr:DUF3397 domain-containing protein [Chengkuizengella sp. 2205SS18-9]MDP5273142.1 DUF3397 domain-containing protein [Chengkuizengella sp. 2205SS18-9]